MRCPNCMSELEDYGNMRECPRCHFATYFNAPRARVSVMPDEDMEF